jgi:hypothetical protein
MLLLGVAISILSGGFFAIHLNHKNRKLFWEFPQSEPNKNAASVSNAEARKFAEIRRKFPVWFSWTGSQADIRWL